MKYYFLSLLLTFSCACTRVLKNPQTTIKDNRCYDSLGHLLTGKVEVFHSNGRISYSSFYKNGIEEGKWISYDLTNTPVQEGYYSRDPDLEALVSRRYKVDYAILDKWSEGDIHFVSGYVALKGRLPQIPKDSLMAYINYLDKYKVANKEIQLRYNEEIIGEVRIW